MPAQNTSLWMAHGVDATLTGWGVGGGLITVCCFALFQRALEATLFSCSSSFQHALETKLLIFSSNFQHALDATLFSF